MSLKLYYIPNMNHFFETVNQCTGHVFLELKDQSYLNLKNNGEGKFFLESVGNHVNGLCILTEEKKDEVKILETLL